MIEPNILTPTTLLKTLKLILQPAYFPNIPTFAALAQGDICWEIWDNYQKQTYRNRCYICTDQGKLLLSVPIIHAGGMHGRQLYKDVLLDNSYPWQRQHWRTLQTAYRSSPFFEFYEDDFVPLFQNQSRFLLDHNLKASEVICNCLQIAMPKVTSERYEMQVKTLVDGRFLVKSKNESIKPQDHYVQVFADRHGFVPNASILDLLFNEGPNALIYLMRQNLDFLHA